MANSINLTASFDEEKNILIGLDQSAEDIQRFAKEAEQYLNRFGEGSEAAFKKATDASNVGARKMQADFRSIQDGADRVSGALAPLAAVTIATMTAMAAAGAYGVTALVQLGNEMEQYGVTLKVLLGDQEKANTALDMFNDFALETTFQLPEIINAGKMLLSFGFELDEVNGLLRDSGDLAAAFGRDLSEVIDIFGRLKSGAPAGEALQRLGEAFGIGRLALQARGAQFSGQGEALGSRTDLIEQVRAEIQARVGGIQAELANTFQGMLSRLEDEWTRFGMRINDSGVFDEIKANMAGLVDEIDRLGKAGVLDKLAAQIGTALVAAIKDMAGAFEGANLEEQLQSFADMTVAVVNLTGAYGKNAVELAKWVTDNQGLIEIMGDVAIAGTVIYGVAKLVRLLAAVGGGIASLGALIAASPVAGPVLGIAAGVGVLVGAGVAIGKLQMKFMEYFSDEASSKIREATFDTHEYLAAWEANADAGTREANAAAEAAAAKARAKALEDLAAAQKALGITTRENVINLDKEVITLMGSGTTTVEQAVAAHEKLLKAAAAAGVPISALNAETRAYAETMFLMEERLKTQAQAEKNLAEARKQAGDEFKAKEDERVRLVELSLAAMDEITRAQQTAADVEARLEQQRIGEIRDFFNRRRVLAASAFAAEDDILTQAQQKLFSKLTDDLPEADRIDIMAQIIDIGELRAQVREAAGVVRDELDLQQLQFRVSLFFDGDIRQAENATDAAVVGLGMLADTLGDVSQSARFAQKTLSNVFEGAAIGAKIGGPVGSGIGASLGFVASLFSMFGADKREQQRERQQAIEDYNNELERQQRIFSAGLSQDGDIPGQIRDTIRQVREFEDAVRRVGPTIQDEIDRINRSHSPGSLKQDLIDKINRDIAPTMILQAENDLKEAMQTLADLTRQLAEHNLAQVEAQREFVTQLFDLGASEQLQILEKQLGQFFQTIEELEGTVGGDERGQDLRRQMALRFMDLQRSLADETLQAEIDARREAAQVIQDQIREDAEAQIEATRLGHEMIRDTLTSELRATFAIENQELRSRFQEKFAAAGGNREVQEAIFEDFMNQARALEAGQENEARHQAAEQQAKLEEMQIQIPELGDILLQSGETLQASIDALIAANDQAMDDLGHQMIAAFGITLDEFINQWFALQNDPGQLDQGPADVPIINFPDSMWVRQEGAWMVGQDASKPWFILTNAYQAGGWDVGQAGFNWNISGMPPLNISTMPTVQIDYDSSRFPVVVVGTGSGLSGSGTPSPDIRVGERNVQPVQFGPGSIVVHAESSDPNVLAKNLMEAVDIIMDKHGSLENAALAGR